MQLNLRMYFLVPYNLSPIQQGIQAGHAALEYAREFGNNETFVEFADHHKTWIVLNGGTTRDEPYNVGIGKPLARGTMNETKALFDIRKIRYSYFREPDLNFAITAICFICDERVYDKEMYPDLPEFFGNKNILEEDIIKSHPNKYREWVSMIGGEDNVFLRSIISNKKLAG